MIRVSGTNQISTSSKEKKNKETRGKEKNRFKIDIEADTERPNL